MIYICYLCHLLSCKRMIAKVKAEELTKNGARAYFKINMKNFTCTDRKACADWALGLKRRLYPHQRIWICIFLKTLNLIN